MPTRPNNPVNARDPLGLDEECVGKSTAVFDAKGGVTITCPKGGGGGTIWIGSGLGRDTWRIFQGGSRGRGGFTLGQLGGGAKALKEWLGTPCGQSVGEAAAIVLPGALLGFGVYKGYSIYRGGLGAAKESTKLFEAAIALGSSKSLLQSSACS